MPQDLRAWLGLGGTCPPCQDSWTSHQQSSREDTHLPQPGGQAPRAVGRILRGLPTLNMPSPRRGRTGVQRSGFIVPTLTLCRRVGNTGRDRDGAGAIGTTLQLEEESAVTAHGRHWPAPTSTAVGGGDSTCCDLQRLVLGLSLPQTLLGGLGVEPSGHHEEGGWADEAELSHAEGRTGSFLEED